YPNSISSHDVWPLHFPHPCHSCRGQQVLCMQTAPWSAPARTDSLRLTLMRFQNDSGNAFAKRRKSLYAPAAATSYLPHRALQGEVLDQHPDLSRLGETDHVHELGDEAPVG